ncbi:competence protein CoiA [Vulgatibacter sp.]|uniref:competence protein CoiA n=1 Tax=Vulgatibacter sp. TaxID=1971226 RepID=UPI003565A34C
MIGPRVEVERTRALSDAGELRCPCCDEPVVFRAGARVIAHFAHRAGAACALSDDPDYRPESELHLSTKLALYDWVRACFPEAEVMAEAPIPATGQRADLLAVIDGKPVAFEVQCSPLSGEAWRVRHAGYAKAGVRDVWILTGQAPRFVMIPGSERHGLPPSYRFQLRDLAATVLHDTGELLLSWPKVAARDRRREPLFAQLQKGAPASANEKGTGPFFAAISALSAYHARPAPPWRERPFRDSLVISGAYVAASQLAACSLDPAVGLFVGDRHEGQLRAALARDAEVEAVA